MRFIAFASLLALAACSEGAAPKKEEAAKDSSKLQFSAGQWQTASEVTSMDKQDAGTPAMKAEPGTKTSVDNCVAEADVKKPPAAVLAGLENATCQYQDFYMRSGRINASMSCTRPDLKGKVLVSTEGRYTDTSFDLNSDVRTSLVTDGDIHYSAKVTGRHSGACAAEPAKAS